MPGFTIPDEVEAAFAPQARLFQTDLEILAAGSGLTGVVSGCAVTAQGTPDMTVAVAAGVVRSAGTRLVVAGGNATITAADATNPRIDVVVVTSGNALAVRAGTPAASPIAPALTAGDVALAQVYVPANDTAIGATQIVDRRVTVFDDFTAGTFLAAGINPASAGSVRLPNAGWLTGRNQANSADLNLLRANSANFAELGTRVSYDETGEHSDRRGALMVRRAILTNPTPGYRDACIYTHLESKGIRTVGEGRTSMSISSIDHASVVTKAITGAVNNGSGLIRITATGHTFVTGDQIAIYDVGGTTEANNWWTVTVIDANTFDLQGSTFTNAYTSGGFATNRSLMYGLFVHVAPLFDRGMTGLAEFADDIGGVVGWNGGEGKATDFIYLGNNNTTFNKAVTGAVNNGSGLVRLTVTAHGLKTHDRVVIQDVGGVTVANNSWNVTVIDANTVDLQNSTFSGTYTSGGTLYRSEWWTQATFSSNADYGIRLNGQYGSVALDLSAGIIPTNSYAMRFGSGQKIGGVKVDGSTVSMFRWNTADEFQVDWNCRFAGGINVTFNDVANMVFGTTTGTKIGTATTQKLSFFNATPIVQPTSTTDLRTALVNLGLIASGGATPLNLNGGNLTANYIDVAELSEQAAPSSGFGRIFANTNKLYFKADSGALYDLTASAGSYLPLAGGTLDDAANIAVGTTTGTKIGTATTQKLGFFNSTPIVQPSSTTDLRTALINLGLYATGGASPLNLNGGAFTALSVTLTGTVPSGGGELNLFGNVIDAYGINLSATVSAASANFGLANLSGTVVPTTAALAALYGLLFLPQIGPNGGVSNNLDLWAGMRSSPGAASAYTGTITNIYCYWATSPSKNGGSATFTNVYGYHCNTISTGANNWAFYAVSNPSFFGGQVHASGGLRVGSSATVGHVLTADVNGVATFQANPAAPTFITYTKFGGD